MGICQRTILPDSEGEAPYHTSHDVGPFGDCLFCQKKRLHPTYQFVVIKLHDGNGIDGSFQALKCDFYIFEIQFHVQRGLGLCTSRQRLSPVISRKCNDSYHMTTHQSQIWSLILSEVDSIFLLSLERKSPCR